jgi:hypothetical protein
MFCSDMKNEDRFKVWSGYAEISRKWASVMDAKAGFIAAMNFGLVGFLWSGAKLSDCNGLVSWSVIGSTVLSLASVIAAISVALPRERLSSALGSGMRWSANYQPISYYGFVATAYNGKKFEKFRSHVDSLTYAALANEALEQHFVLSHVVLRKAGFVKLAGIFLLLALVLAGTALILRFIV